MAPTAMNAPASTARLNVVSPGASALRVPITSAFRAISGGRSESIDEGAWVSAGMISSYLQVPTHLTYAIGLQSANASG